MAMKIRLLILAAGLAFAVKSFALVPCPEGSSHLFDDCSGSHVYANGDSYAGEWKDGKKHGQGIYTWADGERYEGEWDSGTKSASMFDASAPPTPYITVGTPAAQGPPASNVPWP